VGEGPVERARAPEHRSDPKPALVDAHDRRDLAEVAGREDLVGRQEGFVGQGLLAHLDAVAAQESNDAAPRYPVEEGPVRRWREHNAVLDQEDVGVGELGDGAQHVAHDAVVEAPPLRLDQRAGPVGIEAPGLRIDGRGLDRRTPEGGKGHGHARGLGHRRLVER